jgi:tRNA-specific 2-thiouridylase
LDLIEKNARLEGRLLRPLSARLLPPTIPELEGQIDREKLLGLAGRSRKTQLELARQYKITSFAQPAGGCCFLTDEAYSRKFMDILKEKGEEALSLDDVFILGVGRHFRLAAGLRVVIGRDEAENNFISRYTTDKWSAVAKDYPGPLAVIFGEVEQEFWREIASMVARYSDGKHEEKIRVEFLRGKRSKELEVSPASDEFLDAHRI